MSAEIAAREEHLALLERCMDLGRTEVSDLETRLTCARKRLDWYERQYDAVRLLQRSE